MICASKSRNVCFFRLNFRSRYSTTITPVSYTHLALDKASALALSKLFLTPEKDLEDKKISDVLPDTFWDTNFWLYWQTMFAFQRWSSALEMKRYLCRYVHHIDGLPDFSALRFTKYNQYESMIPVSYTHLKHVLSFYVLYNC